MQQGRSACTAVRLIIKSSLLDVSARGITTRIAPDINSILRLVNSDVVDPHMGWKCETREVNRAEIPGHSQVCDNVLQMTKLRI